MLSTPAPIRKILEEHIVGVGNTLASLGGLQLNEIGYHGLPSSMGHGDQGPGLKWLWAENCNGFNTIMAPNPKPPEKLPHERVIF